MSKKSQCNILQKEDILERGWSNELIKKFLPPELEDGGWYEYIVVGVEDENQNNRRTKALFANVYKTRRLQEKKRRNELVEAIAREISIVNPADDYPLARKMHRHFIIHVGETNTGKTYGALQALKQCSSGVYLSPLRLLAMEVQDSLLADGCLCSMTTGEEENIVPNATVMSSTVEKVQLNQHYAVGVIDECQMIADKDRGGAWTRAILGLCADTIYLCMSENALDICIRLIEMCNDTYEVKNCYRTSTLRMADAAVSPRDLTKGDAIILFSRKEVLRYAKTLESLGMKVSVIYGSLPYEARKYQVEMYRNGETDIVVATDAIGMGLNLPIKRIIFAEGYKFDGHCKRALAHYEIKQIAGRAGRRGIYEEGLVSVFTKGDADLQYIDRSLAKPYKPIQSITIPFPETCIRGDVSVSEAMRAWLKIQYPDCFVSENLEDRLAKVEFLEGLGDELSAEMILVLSKVIFDTKNDVLFTKYRRYVDYFLSGKKIEMPALPMYSTLANLEFFHKELQLYYSFHNVLGLEINLEMLNELKCKLIDRLNNELEKEKKDGSISRCTSCGKKLPPFFKFNICQRCYDMYHYF